MLIFLGLGGVYYGTEDDVRAISKPRIGSLILFLYEAVIPKRGALQPREGSPIETNRRDETTIAGIATDPLALGYWVLIPRRLDMAS